MYTGINQGVQTMATKTYPTLEMEDGKRYVLIPEEVYKTQTTGKPVSKDIAQRVKDLKAGKLERVKAVDVHKGMIADELKEARHAAGISQAKLADLAGVRVETISRIESGKTGTRADTINKLMEVISRFRK